MSNPEKTINQIQEIAANLPLPELKPEQSSGRRILNGLAWLVGASAVGAATYYGGPAVGAMVSSLTHALYSLFAG